MKLTYAYVAKELRRKVCTDKDKIIRRFILLPFVDVTEKFIGSITVDWLRCATLRFGSLRKAGGLH